LEIDQDRALEIAKHMSEQYMKLIYANASKIIGQCILQAGLVGKKDARNLARMIRAACKGAHKATLDEADAIAKEHKKERILS
jgi:hypothetical protein